MLQQHHMSLFQIRCRTEGWKLHEIKYVRVRFCLLSGDSFINFLTGPASAEVKKYPPPPHSAWMFLHQHQSNLLSLLQLAGHLGIVWQVRYRLTLVAAKQQIICWLALAFFLRRDQHCLVVAALVSHAVPIISQEQMCVHVCVWACVCVFRCTSQMCPHPPPGGSGYIRIRGQTSWGFCQQANYKQLQSERE